MARKLKLCSFTARAHQMRTYTHTHTLFPSRALSRSLSHTHIYTHTRPLTHIYKQHTLSHPHFRTTSASRTHKRSHANTPARATPAPPTNNPEPNPANVHQQTHAQSNINTHDMSTRRRVRFTSAKFIFIHSIRYTVCLLRKQNNVWSSVTMCYLTVVLTTKLTCNNHSSRIYIGGPVLCS